MFYVSAHCKKVVRKKERKSLFWGFISIALTRLELEWYLLFFFKCVRSIFESF